MSLVCDFKTLIILEDCIMYNLNSFRSLESKPSVLPSPRGLIAGSKLFAAPSTTHSRTHFPTHFPIHALLTHSTYSHSLLTHSLNPNSNSYKITFFRNKTFLFEYQQGTQLYIIIHIKEIPNKSKQTNKR